MSDRPDRQQDRQQDSQQNAGAQADDASAGLPPSGKLLGLDMGLARIGIAVCDPLRLAARPLRTLTRRSRNADFAELAAIVQAEDVTGVVCGLPLNMDGSSGPQAATTRKWAMRLAHALRALLGRPIAVALWDERLSTYAANQLADRWSPEVGEDAAAAAVILQSLLDALRRGEPVNEVIVLPPRPAATDETGAVAGPVQE